MRRAIPMVFIGTLVALVGMVWILQGLNVIVSSSFMTGSRAWVVLGAVAVVGGGAFSWWGWTLRSR